MSTIFIDTGYIIALEMARDQHHESATIHWNSVPRDDLDLTTTTYVLDEIVTFLVSRGYHDKAVAIGRILLDSSDIKLIHIDEPLLMEVWRYFERHTDKQYSLTDCISFVVMLKYEMQTAYAYDKNFVQAGFSIEPTE